MVLRGNRTGLEAKFYELLLEVTAELGYKLYDLDYISGSHTLRVFIMDEKTGTAILDDCAKVDRALTPYSEELEWMPEELMLEVSSPGIFRTLNELWHFESAVNESVMLSIMGRLSDYTEVELPKSLKTANKFVAKLLAVKEDSLTLDVDGNEIQIEFKNIKKANLEPDLED